MDKPSNEIINKNKELLAKWPWLEKRNVFSGKPSREGEEKYYSTVWNDWDGLGWEKIWKKFLTKLGEIWEKLPDNEFKKSFSIFDNKEKYGTLRTCLSGYVPGMFDLEMVLEATSGYTCYICGKQPRDSKGNRLIWNSKGWILPYCRECAKKDFMKNKGRYFSTNWKEHFSRDVYKGKFKVSSYNNGIKETRELENL